MGLVAESLPAVEEARQARKVKPRPFEYVYLGVTTRWVKIGIAVDVERRLKELRSQGVQEIAGKWHRPNDYRLVEYQVRWMLRDRAAPRQGQEWFDVSVEEALRVVEQAIADVEAGRNRFPPQWHYWKRRRAREGKEK